MTMNTRSAANPERLAFNYGPGTVPSQRAIDAALARDAEPTFATAPYAEPRDWGYVGLIAFTAVLLLRPQDQLPGLGALHLAEICAFIGIGPMLLHRFARRLPVFRVTPETMGLLVFGLVILATAPFSIWPGGAFELFFDSYLKIVIVFVLMMNTLTTPKRLAQLTWLIVCCCGYIAARAVFDYARGVNLVEGGRVGGAVSGIFGNPNDLALNMVTFMPAALMVALTARESPVKRLTAAAIAALMLATVVFTKSRGGALGMGVMLLAVLFLGRKIRPGFTIMALGAVLLATPFLPASFWERMATITDEQQDKTHYTGSSEARRVVMEEGIDAFLTYPLTGVGAGQFKNYNPPERKERWRETHNALIQVAADTGLFGLIVFSFLIVRGGMAAGRTRRLLTKPRRRQASDPLATTLSDEDQRSLYAYTAALTAGLVGWFTCALFASVAYSWTFYYLLALIVATHELVRARLSAAYTLESAAVQSTSVLPNGFSPKRQARAGRRPGIA
jgi:putative inorganic carbon (hco3(-)) transporter